ncbi:hypothetical protein CH281_17080 [Rhodococcus sp. 06-221-2]|nr:hypothetical protein CH281_17080 [Rhodococcus sp. 06-221-2]
MRGVVERPTTKGTETLPYYLWDSITASGYAYGCLGFFLGPVSALVLVPLLPLARGRFADPGLPTALAIQAVGLRVADVAPALLPRFVLELARSVEDGKLERTLAVTAGGRQFSCPRIRLDNELMTAFDHVPEVYRRLG